MDYPPQDITKQLTCFLASFVKCLLVKKKKKKTDPAKILQNPF